VKLNEVGKPARPRAGLVNNRLTITFDSVSGAPMILVVTIIYAESCDSGHAEMHGFEKVQQVLSFEETGNSVWCGVLRIDDVDVTVTKHFLSLNRRWLKKRQRKR